MNYSRLNSRLYAYEACRKAEEIAVRYSHETASAKGDRASAWKWYLKGAILRQTWDIVASHVLEYLLASDFDP